MRLGRNVRLHQISVAVALHDNKQALRLADQLDTSQLPLTLASRRAQAHLDLAVAHSATDSSAPGDAPTPGVRTPRP